MFLYSYVALTHQFKVQKKPIYWLPSLKVQLRYKYSIKKRILKQNKPIFEIKE